MRSQKPPHPDHRQDLRMSLIYAGHMRHYQTGPGLAQWVQHHDDAQRGLGLAPLPGRCAPACLCNYPSTARLRCSVLDLSSSFAFNLIWAPAAGVDTLRNPISCEAS